MKHLAKPLLAALTPRQQTLEFMGSERWQQLPAADQEACRQALAQLLRQVISPEQKDNSHEREDSNPTS